MIGKGLVFKIQRSSIHDGPGIRSTVFLKGCMLKCMWCCNPESQAPYPELLFNKSKCPLDCVDCMDTCKNRAILKDDIGVNVDKTLCTNCGVCTNKCNTGALTLIGEWVTAERVLEELESDKVFYEKSKGGVTVSGGEPLFQPKFTEDLLRLSKERRIHTALDTSGFGSWRHMKKILKYVDLVLFDIKHMDPIVHRKYTGVVNESILKNALRTSQDGKDMAIRVPVIPTINDQRENIDRIAEFVGRLRNVQEVDLLPYHKLGISKYGMLGRKYLLRHLQMNERVLLDIRKQLEHYGFQVRIVR